MFENARSAKEPIFIYRHPFASSQFCFHEFDTADEVGKLE